MWPSEKKPAKFVPQLNFILLAQPVDVLNNYPSQVYQMLNVNQSAFLEGTLLTLYNHDWKMAPMEGDNWVVGT